MAMFQGVNNMVNKLKKHHRDSSCKASEGRGPDFCSGLDVKSLLTSNLARCEVIVQMVTNITTNAAQRFSLGWRDAIPCPVIFWWFMVGVGEAVCNWSVAGDFRIASLLMRTSRYWKQSGANSRHGRRHSLCESWCVKITPCEMAMTAKVIDCETAKGYGLVTKIAEDPYAEAYALALECANRSSLVMLSLLIRNPLQQALGGQARVWLCSTRPGIR